MTSHKPAAFLTLLLCAVGLFAQSTSGTLTGHVTTAAGTAIPGAAVTITNIDTNSSKQVLTAADGSFSIAGLPPGNYRVDVQTAGYKRTSQQNVVLAAATPATLNLTLEPGSAAETVAIRGFTPLVQAQSTEEGVGLPTTTIAELPVVDRNHQQLAELQSGITPPEPLFDRAQDPVRNRYYSTNGQSPFVNVDHLEGAVNLEPFRGGAIRVAPNEALQQMNLVTASPAPGEGFAGGALITDITKSGTNNWHGSLFEFHGNDDLLARSALDVAPNPAPRFVYNQFGASGGGAIVPDRTFIFGSYEGTYENGGITSLSTVPLPQVVGGNFSGIPGVSLFYPFGGSTSGAGRLPLLGNTIPAGLINPASAAIARFLPAPNLPGLADNYVSNVPFRQNANNLDLRVDQHFGKGTTAFLRYGYTNALAYQASSLGGVIGSASRGRLVGQNAIAGLTHEVTPALLTDFRFGYNRYDQHVNPYGDESPLASSLAMDNFANNLSGINIDGMPAIGPSPYVPEHAVDNTFNWVWNWAYQTSKHAFQWGVDIRRIRSDGFTESMPGAPFGPTGTAYFGPGPTMLNGGPGLTPVGGLYNSFAAFLMGAPTQLGAVGYLTTPTIRQSEYGFWVGDKMQILPRLTLDLGIRYEVYSPIEPARAGGAEVYNAATNQFNYAGQNGTAMHSYGFDLNNIAPRVGLAVRVTDRTAVRAGYGMEYYQSPYMLSGLIGPRFGWSNGVAGGYQMADVGRAFTPTLAPFGPPPALPNGTFTGNLPAAVVPASLETPYVQTLNFQVQQEIAGMVLGLGYVGALGRHVPAIRELNAALPGTGVLGLPYFVTPDPTTPPMRSWQNRTASTVLYDDALTSNYNSLQVSLSRRFAQGLSLQAAYTWSKALGYVGNNERLLNPFDLRANYGPLDNDRQHVFSFSHLWEIPVGRHGTNLVSTVLGGWQVNGVFTWATGTPLTITTEPLACNCPGNMVLADLVGSPVVGSGAAWLNPAAFSSPAANQFGALGRGSLRGPGFRNYDFSLFKNFRMYDIFNLELRGEAFNLTNSPHFANPVTSLASPDFGRAVSLMNGAFGRDVHLGLRLLF